MCGSTVLMQYYHESERLGIAAATIDRCSTSWPRLSQHIFLDEKVQWYELPIDSVERFGTRSKKAQEKLDSWWNASINNTK